MKRPRRQPPIQMLTTDEVAEALRIDKRTLVKIIKAGKLPALKAGVGPSAGYRISEKALNEYIKRESAAQVRAVR
jgi:excisionase family DNA binding protein